MEQVLNNPPQTRDSAGNGASVSEAIQAKQYIPPELLSEPSDALEELKPDLHAVRQYRERPLFLLISHEITADTCHQVFRWRKELREAGGSGGFDVLIDSPGGELSACYQTARLIGRYTNSWDALVPHQAASGATLLCLGSTALVMSSIAHLGPIDPQVRSKRHEKFFEFERQSPLEAFQAVRYLREFGLQTVDATMDFLWESGVASHLALETATRFAAQLATPILQKVEPYDLGSFALDSKLARDYCRRVCDPPDSSKRTQRNVNSVAIVEEYPAHEFLIDIDEARVLGFNVIEPTDELDLLFDQLRPRLERVHTCIGFLSPQEEAKSNEP